MKNKINFISLISGILLVVSLVSFVSLLFWGTNESLNIVFNIGAILFYCFIILLVHELSHVVACLITKTTIKKVNVFPFCFENKRLRLADAFKTSVVFVQNTKKRTFFVYLSGVLEFISAELILVCAVLLSNNLSHWMILSINSLYIFTVFSKNSDFCRVVQIGKELKA